MNASLRQTVDLAEEHFGIDHNGIGDHAYHAFPDGAAGQEMQRESAISDDYRMSGVGPTSITNDDIALLGQDIDDFPLAFITPL
jgi:hypothetical protein